MAVVYFLFLILRHQNTVQGSIYLTIGAEHWRHDYAKCAQNSGCTLIYIVTHLDHTVYFSKTQLPYQAITYAVGYGLFR